MGKIKAIKRIAHHRLSLVLQYKNALPSFPTNIAEPLWMSLKTK